MKAIIPVIAAEIEDQIRDLAKRAGDKIELQKQPGAKALRTWVTAYENAKHDPTALLDNYRDCGSKTPRLSPEIEHLMGKHAEQFADERRPTKVKLYGELCDEITSINETRKAEGLPVLEKPCLRVFRDRVNAIPAYKVYAGRYGVAAAQKKFYVISTGLDVTRPGELVQIDEHEVSLQTLLAKAGVWSKLTHKQRKEIERGRFWLGAAIDVASRCYLGLRILPQSNKNPKQPDAPLAIATLKMAVTDKTHFAMGVGAASAWYMRCGIETIVTDQGSAYISREFHKTATAIGAFIDHPPGKKPYLRGHIERSFGTMRTKLIGAFTGQTFANVGERGDYPAEARASLTGEELCWAIVRFVVDAYHNTPHEGLGGETPREAWDRLTKIYGVVPPPDRDTVRNAFGIVLKPRRLDQRGIRFCNLYYQSKDLQLHRRQVGDCKLEIIVDPDDIGRISVHLGDNRWLTVPCMQAGFIGVSARDWLEATADLKRRFASNDQRFITEKIARDALKAIQDMADSAVRRANIGTTTLSAEELYHGETSLEIAWSTPTDPSISPEETNPDLFGDTVKPAAPEPKPDADPPRNAGGDAPNTTASSKPSKKNWKLK
jgi:putative transposase